MPAIGYAANGPSGSDIRRPVRPTGSRCWIAFRRCVVSYPTPTHAVRSASRQPSIAATRPMGACPVRPRGLEAGHATPPVGLSLHQAGIDGEPFATHQPFPHAALQNLLEHEAQRVAVTEAAMPVLGERRVVRHRI